MPRTHRFYTFLLVTLFAASALSPRTADATIVEVETVLGNFQINLYDDATPLTVENFLNYVQNGAYSDSIFHRSAPGFIIQSGGFNLDANAQVGQVTANPAVTNEPVFSNVRGTIAMAKLGGNPNSATNQWFINLANNSGNLDAQNGGFTAFGEVTGNGMDIVDAIAALPVFGFDTPLSELPLRDYSANDFTNRVDVERENFIVVTAITVIDTTVDSAGDAGLNPPRNATDNGGGPVVGGGGGGGGSFAVFTLLGLFASIRLRRTK